MLKIDSDNKILDKTYLNSDMNRIIRLAIDSWKRLNDRDDGKRTGHHSVSLKQNDLLMKTDTSIDPSEQKTHH